MVVCTGLFSKITAINVCFFFYNVRNLKRLFVIVCSLINTVFEGHSEDKHVIMCVSSGNVEYLKRLS